MQLHASYFSTEKGHTPFQKDRQKSLPTQRSPHSETKQVFLRTTVQRSVELWERNSESGS